MDNTFKLNHLTPDQVSEKYGLPRNRKLFGTHTPIVGGDRRLDSAQLQEQIRQYFHSTMDVYEKVFECLKNEAAFFVPPVHRLRHPMIFYYGHTAAFYINKLVLAGGLAPRINPFIEEHVSVGVDEMSWDDLNEAHYDWPSVEEVTAYRLRVRDVVDELCRSEKFSALTLPLTFANSTTTEVQSFWWTLLMSCEHERIHLETASVHVRELPLQYVRQSMSAFWDRCPEQSQVAPKNTMVDVPAGTVMMGRPPDSPVYGWDIDYSNGKAKTHVPAFRASQMLVSNGEFFEFIVGGGYTTRKYWDEEGWAWASWKKPEHPWFWVKSESNDNNAADAPCEYKLRLQTELIDLPWNWPVEVNNLEAKAFTKFKQEKTGQTLRLLTEAEWLRLHDLYVKADEYEWDKLPDGAPGNLNLEHYRSSNPVDMFAQGPFFDIVGNVWQHTENPVYPYTGFNIHPFYDDFSVPTFDDRHTCMKGGTWISTGNEATRDARYAFRRHFFQYIGIRYVEEDPKSGATANGQALDLKPHLSKDRGVDPEVNATTAYAYADTIRGIPNIHVAIADYSKQIFSKHSTMQPGRALNLLCGAGRVTYELTTMFHEVLGSDATARKLIPAYAMREHGAVMYTANSSSAAGSPSQKHEVRASEFEWYDTRERAHFVQSDPANLHAHMNHFDLIVAFDLLENVKNAAAVPPHLLSRLNPGGILIVASALESKGEIARHSTDFLLKLLPNTTVIADPITMTGVHPTSKQSGKSFNAEVTAFQKSGYVNLY